MEGNIYVYMNEIFFSNFSSKSNVVYRTKIIYKYRHDKSRMRLLQSSLMLLSLYYFPVIPNHSDTEKLKKRKIETVK